MSHELWIIDGVAQAAYNPLHGAPWWVSIGLDGIGTTELDSVEDIERHLPLGHVIKRPMQVIGANGEPIQVEGQSVTCREVPAQVTTEGVMPARTFPLAPTSERYGVVQDQDVARIALASGRPISCFSLLDEGRRSCASVRLDPLVIDPNGVADRLDRFLNVFNSHDGSRHLMAAEGTIRVVCANTEQMALRQGGAVHKLRHSSQVGDRLDEMAGIVAEATNAGALIVAQAEEMLRIDGDKAMDVVLDHFWSLEAGDSDRKKTRRKNLREQVVQVARGPLAEETVGWNGWAVYNGVTEFLDHHRTVRGADDERVARLGQALDPLAPTSDDKVKTAELILSVA